MSLRIRFRFDGKCGIHPRYDPVRDGRPQHGKCEGCESLYVIHLYCEIAKRRAENSNVSWLGLRAAAKLSALPMSPPRFQKKKPIEFGHHTGCCRL